MEQKPEKPARPKGSYIGLGVALGAGIGVALGVAFNNIAVGIAVGIAIGVPSAPGSRARITPPNSPAAGGASAG